jgi:hypothetical protein
MHERAMETRESICVPREAKSFFIPMVHGPLRVLGHVAAPELSSRGGRVQSGEVESEAEGHMTVPELTSTVRRGLELRNM